MREVMKRVLAGVMAGCMAVASGGCVYLVAGGIGALGGYVISPDTVEGVVASTQDEIWDAAYEVLGIMGKVEYEDEKGGEVIALVSGARVTVTVVTVNLTSSRLTIKARKAFFPKIKLAQDVYAKIVRELGR